MRILETSLGNFPVPQPTVEDGLCVAYLMRELAKKRLPSPVEYAMAQKWPNAAMLELAIRTAIQLGSSNGGGTPDVALQQEMYVDEEGIAVRVQYHVSRLKPDFTLEQARQVVAKDGRWVILDRLEAALEDPKSVAKKNDGGTGTPTS